MWSLEKDIYITVQHVEIMTLLKDYLIHLKSHLKYPATKKELVTTCNNLADLPEDKDWFAKTLPEGTYKAPVDVLKALLDKV